MIHAIRKYTRTLVPTAMFAALLPVTAGACDWNKLAFDRTGIDRNGLIGPPGGERHLDYEFCAPADPAFLAHLRRISPYLLCRPGAKGRSACRSDQALCLGSSADPDWSATLCRITDLRRIERVNPSWWE